MRWRGMQIRNWAANERELKTQKQEEIRVIREIRGLVFGNILPLLSVNSRARANLKVAKERLTLRSHHVNDGWSARYTLV
jgi:hypothetical protein